MKSKPGVADAVRLLASGEPVDWESLRAGCDDPGVRALVQDLQVVARITTFHQALQSAVEDPAAAALASVGPGAVEPAPDADRPASWGSLELLERVGRGSFADVYRAWDPRLDREVALKLLRARESANTPGASTVIEEARLLARVRHAGVVTVHGAERIDGQVGLWTEFIHGRTLAQLVADEGPFSADAAAAIGIDLCRALGAVHQAGLLHRDIKAQNVMREPGGRVVLLDFGAGKQRLEDAIATGGDLSGTPLYLAPEIWTGAAATPRSDIYSLAVLLYHLVSGSFPVRGATLNDVRTAHAANLHTSLRAARPELPATFADTIDRALASEPSERYGTVAAFEAALEGTRPSRLRRPILAATVAAAMVAIAAIGAWALKTSGVRDAVVPPPRREVPSPSSVSVQPRSDPGPSVAAPIPPATAPEAPTDRASVTASNTSTPAGPASDPVPPIRKIRLPQYPMGRPSRDGRYYPYADKNGDLQVWDAATGRSRRVTDVSTSTESVRSALMSPNGDRIVYGWATADQGFELREINSDGTSPHVLIPRTTVYQPVPLDWSRDGQNVLCRLLQKDRSLDLALVPASGAAAPRVLLTFRGEASPRYAKLSPDGRFVVYDMPSAPGSEHRSLFLIDTNGSPPRALLANPVNDYAALWTADGGHVVFARDSPTRSVFGSTDAWMVPVVNGFASGDPTLVVANTGPVVGWALSDDGALSNMVTSDLPDVYTVTFNLSGVVPAGPPTRISSAFVGNHVAPAWSPDGQSIAYMTLRQDPAHNVSQSILTIQDWKSGKAHELRPTLKFLGSYIPQWSHDGRSLIVWGRDSRDRWGYFRVDRQTSETTALVLVSGNIGPAYSQCSPDGRAFLYVDPDRGLVGLEFATGEESVVVGKGVWSTIGPFSISPDGRSIAFVATERHADRSWTQRLELRGADGVTRELLTVKGPESLMVQMWTPDSRGVLYTSFSGADEPHPLWLIDAASGERRDLHFPTLGNPRLALSPDGTRLAYAERNLFWELWVRERFLPIAIRAPRPRAR